MKWETCEVGDWLVAAAEWKSEEGGIRKGQSDVTHRPVTCLVNKTIHLSPTVAAGGVGKSQQKLWDCVLCDPLSKQLAGHRFIKGSCSAD